MENRIIYVLGAILGNYSAQKSHMQAPCTTKCRDIVNILKYLLRITYKKETVSLLSNMKFWMKHLPGTPTQIRQRESVEKSIQTLSNLI